MKQLTLNILRGYAIALAVAAIAAFFTHWWLGKWELSTLVFLTVLICEFRGSIGTFYSLRRNPEYQKDNSPDHD